MSTKDRKLGFYLLAITAKEDHDCKLSAAVLKPLIAHILSLPEKSRLVDLTRYHSCHFLADSAIEGKTQTLIFKSGKYHHRPPLFDKATTKERDSPKTLSEAESEKTHLVLRYGTDEIGVIAEERKSGVGIHKVVGYLNRFRRDLERKKVAGFDYAFETGVLAKEDFLKELKALKSVKVGEIHMEKKLLGEEFFNFSERTENVQKDLTLTLRSERGKSIFGPIADIYDKYKNEDRVKKLRVYGYGAAGQLVVLDTDLIRKIEYVEANIDDQTGVVDTPSFLLQVKPLLDAFDAG
jgi:hypothetical protein